MTSRLWLLAIVTLVAALVLRSSLLGAAALMLVGAMLSAAWWTGRVERGLRVRQTVDDTVAFGAEATVTIEITNTSLLPVPWLQMVDSVPLALRVAPPLRTAFSLGAGASRRMTYRVRGGRRGFYQLGPLRLATGDVLGLYRRGLTGPVAPLTVFPQVLPLHELGLPAQAPFGPLATRQRRGEDPARPAGVRPYQASDGVRRLDWKSTARHGDLLVRRAEPSIAPETTIALAFRRDDFPARVLQDALERAATVAASLGAALAARKLPVGLVSNGVDPKHPGAEVVLPAGKGDGHLHMLLSLLGRLDAAGGPPIFELLTRLALPWGGTLALILADFQSEFLAPIGTLRRRGQHVSVFLLEPTPDGLALARAHRLLSFAVDRRGLPVAARAY